MRSLLLTGAAALLFAAGAQAQVPAVGSTVNLGTDWPVPLYPEPATGNESTPQRHAMTQATQDMLRRTCHFTRGQVGSELGGQPPYLFRVMEARDVEHARRIINGQVLTETRLWLRLVNQHRPSCSGWWDLGTANAGKAPTGSTAEAPAPTTPPPGGAAAEQPPGFACPPGWMPNPSGALQRGGGFKCFADTRSSIPAGWQCPSGLKLKDHSATGVLVCDAR